MKAGLTAAYFALAMLSVAPPALAAELGPKFPLAGSQSLRSVKPFEDLWNDLRRAVESHRMLVVAQASASRGAASRGVAIPGNAIVEVFRNDYAVRMLEASVGAGYEAPLRFYIVETPSGSLLMYRTPTAVFAPYGSEQLNLLADELDDVFAQIAAEAIRVP